MFEVLEGRNAYGNYSDDEIRIYLSKGGRPIWSTTVISTWNYIFNIPEMLGLVQHCWTIFPDERPSFSRILEYLNGIKSTCKVHPTSSTQVYTISTIQNVLHLIASQAGGGASIDQNQNTNLAAAMDLLYNLPNQRTSFVPSDLLFAGEKSENSDEEEIESDALGLEDPSVSVPTGRFSDVFNSVPAEVLENPANPLDDDSGSKSQRIISISMNPIAK